MTRRTRAREFCSVIFAGIGRPRCVRVALVGHRPAVLVEAPRAARPAPSVSCAGNAGSGTPSSQYRVLAAGNDQPSCSAQELLRRIGPGVVPGEFAVAAADGEGLRIPADLVGAGAERSADADARLRAALLPLQIALAAAVLAP